MTLDKINSLSSRDAVTLFRQCCGSLRWAQAMQDRRPFNDEQHLFTVADVMWNSLTHDDWKEAFAHHPRIGNIKELRKKFPTKAHWAEREQAGVQHTTEKVLKAIAEGNNLYEAKFGYIFIVCATGKSADELLATLNKRLSNIPSEEIKIAAQEQVKITKIRLEKLLTQL